MNTEPGSADAFLEDAAHFPGGWFPPAPTFTGATVGGIVSTNAAGAATFKYGSTREWVEGLGGKGAILEFGRAAVALGGCPLAEHGVGRNPVKQALLRQLYGDDGIDAMRAVKPPSLPAGSSRPGSSSRAGEPSGYLPAYFAGS